MNVDCDYLYSRVTYCDKTDLYCEKFIPDLDDEARLFLDFYGIFDFPFLCYRFLRKSMRKITCAQFYCSLFPLFPFLHIKGINFSMVVDLKCCTSVCQDHCNRPNNLICSICVQLFWISFFESVMSFFDMHSLGTENEHQKKKE